MDLICIVFSFHSPKLLLLYLFSHTYEDPKRDGILSLNSQHNLTILQLIADYVSPSFESLQFTPNSYTCLRFKNILVLSLTDPLAFLSTHQKKSTSISILFKKRLIWTRRNKSVRHFHEHWITAPSVMFYLPQMCLLLSAWRHQSLGDGGETGLTGTKTVSVLGL